jgi:hypothetical protein
VATPLQHVGGSSSDGGSSSTTSFSGYGERIDPSAVLWSDVGPDGYGRDSSLVYVRPGVIAVTYMQYAKESTDKHCKLAILSEPSAAATAAATAAAGGGGGGGT